MSDFEPTNTPATSNYHWDRSESVPPGTRIRLVVNDATVIFDKTVPATVTVGGQARNVTSADLQAVINADLILA